MKALLRKIAVLSLACAIGAAAQAAAAETVTVPADKTFKVSGITFGQAYGTVMVIYAVREIGGQHMLCGLSAHEKAQTLRFRRQVLRKGWLKSGGRKVVRDLSFFEEYGVLNKGAPLSGAVAACAPLPASARAPYELGFDRLSIRP